MLKSELAKFYTVACWKMGGRRGIQSASRLVPGARWILGGVGGVGMTAWVGAKTNGADFSKLSYQEDDLPVQMEEILETSICDINFYE